ncbi:MAG TPA: sugar phosphate isomerase/epimerase [Phycisphaerae bacterium]|nr:sugar phosphate isomerase/epimerase [Phycisphaerae bacterium]
MLKPKYQYTVFTKPWKDKTLAELFAFVKGLGFDGVELPVRPGFQVSPETIAEGLPAAARIAADCGLRIGSVAGPTDEKTISACASAGVPLIRIMARIPPETDYFSAVAEHQRQWDRLVPLLDKHGVALGVQHHCWRYIANAMQLHCAIAKYDPRQVCAVWDPAHTGLGGEMEDIALDILWSHLRLVNLKNAYYQRTDKEGTPVPGWEAIWTTGPNGRASWPKVADELRKRGYRGDLCLTAEYTDRDATDRLIAEDLAYAKSLFA